MILSFDAAQTLLDVRWHPGGFAADTAAELGLEFDRQVAVESYDRLVMTRRRSYEVINQTRDRQACMAFWDDLTADWLQGLGIDLQVAPALKELANERMYGPGSVCFKPFPEVVEALENQRAKGFTLIVLSNWDYSLDRTLEATGLAPLFDRTFASLEYGVEKPDPALFRLVEQEMNAGPADFVHFGDHPTDDLQGALGAGWKAVLVDRTLTEPQRPRIPNFSAIDQALAWNG